MPKRTRYEEIAEGAVEAAEKAGGSQVDFCHGLKDIMITLKERLELEVGLLSAQDAEEWELTK